MGGRALVVVTAAKNEEAHIRRTLDAVVAQTLRPKLWVIVSDGSQDGTDRIVADYAQRFPFIRLLRRQAAGERDFRSKSDALGLAIAQLSRFEYSYLCNLDADLSFSAMYFEHLVERFENDHSLGIGGGLVYEVGVGKRFPQRISDNSVAGAVQCFRRECFRQVGGYVRSRYGGEDAAVEIAARMQGWRVQTFPELRVLHHGYQKSLAKSFLRKRFRWGKMFYLLGYQPLFFLARCAVRLGDRPFLVGSLAEAAGFVAMLARRPPRMLAPTTVRYLQREQLHRLLRLLGRR